MHGLNRVPLNLITTTLSLPLPNLPHPHSRRHQPGQLVHDLNPHQSQRSWVRYLIRPYTFVSPSADSRRAVVNYWPKYLYEVLVNRLGGLRLSRKSVGRLTDRPGMTIDVYRGRKTTTHQHNPHPRQRSNKRQSNKHTLKQCPLT